MKICIIADIHFGIRNNSPLFHKKHSSFFNDTFFPFLEKNGIKTIVHNGDFFDKRREISFKTLDVINKCFLNNIEKYDIQCHMIVGNHDSVFKHNLELNAIDLIFDKYSKNIVIYNTPKEIVFDSKKFLMVPWITNESNENILNIIKESSANICCGHFELSGFYMIAGIMNTTGLTSDLFSKFDYTFSGHFHIPSCEKNLIMIGSPIQFTWNDLNNRKRVIVYDTDTNQYESIYLADDNFVSIDFKNNGEQIEPSKIEDCYVKLNIYSKNDPFVLDTYINYISSMNPYKIEILDHTANDFVSTSIQSDDMNKSTIEIIFDSISSNDQINEAIKNDVNSIILSVYNQSLQRRTNFNA